MSPDRCFLYRIYDSAHTLLYVGIARRWGYRLSQHETTAPWRGRVRSIELAWFKTREAAREAERQTILTGSPRHNIVGRRQEDPHRWRDAVEDKLQRARELGIRYAEFELYCNHPECAVREVRVSYKEHPGELPLPSYLTCPACTRPLKPHHIEIEWPTTTPVPLVPREPNIIA